MISICIPTYNRLSSLKRHLSSIFNGFEDYPYEVIIADGGSTDGTLEYLRSLDNDNVKLIEQGKLTGAVKAFNACFRIIKGDYVLIGGDDLILVPKVLIKACELMDKEKQIGLVTPKVLPGPDHLHSLTRWTEQYGSILSFFFIIRVSVLKEMGYFDESLRTYFIDTDASLAVLNLGYTSIVTRDVGIMDFSLRDKSSVTLATTINMAKREQDMKYGEKKWEFLRIKVKEHLRYSPFKRYKSLFFNKICTAMYHAKWLRSFVKRNNKFVLKLYDWLLAQTVIFNDRNYGHLKDFFLAQRYPDEIIS